jgi:hypothetical protein
MGRACDWAGVQRCGNDGHGPSGIRGSRPPAPAPVRYDTILLVPDTTLDQGNFITHQRVLISNLTGCARPPGQSCTLVPLLKWNR